MNQRSSNPNWRPGPEDLAAYVDGELDAWTRRALEAWLRVNPGAAAELDAHAKLQGFWEDTVPPEPSAARWSGLRQHVERQLVQPRRIAGQTRWWAVPLSLGTVAASALIAVMVMHSPGPSGSKAPKQLSSSPIDSVFGSHSSAALVQPPSVLEVLSPEDVDIVSMDLRDQSALVVGAPPLRKPLTLLAPEEVTVENVEDAGQQSKPEFSTNPTPMLWAPSRTAAR